MGKIFLDYVIYNVDLTPLIDDAGPVRARKILATSAYFAAQQENKGPNGPAFARLHLEISLCKDSHLDLPSEDITLLKAALESAGVYCGVVGQLAQVLEGKNPWDHINANYSANGANGASIADVLEPTPATQE